MEHPEWFFAQTKGDLFITMLCDWTKHDLIHKCERDLSLSWKQIYRRGGRAVRVKMSICANKSLERTREGER